MKRNSSIRLMPVTMSGMVLGRFVSVIMNDCGRFFMAWMPMAASVPRIVATTMASKAIVTVTVSAFMMRVS